MTLEASEGVPQDMDQALKYDSRVTKQSQIRKSQGNISPVKTGNIAEAGAEGMTKGERQSGR